MYHTSTLLHASVLLLFLLPASYSEISPPPPPPQPAIVPLHDILGHNVTLSNLYYIRNYTVGSYSGAGIALYSFRYPCASLVGLASSASNLGLPVRLVPFLNGTVIFPGQRFKIVFENPAPCGTSSEWALAHFTSGTYVVSGETDRSKESYFSVAVDELGRYSLGYCGPCALCKNLCIPLGLSPGEGLLRDPGRGFNFFFQKKVKKDSLDLFQSL